MDPERAIERTGPPPSRRERPGRRRRVEADSPVGGFGRWPRGERTRESTSLPAPSGETALWLAAATAAACLVVAAYLLTHAHPAYEGGLYLEMVESVRRGGFALPERIAGYTVDGVPFAYPPLLFYAVAGLVAATGVDPVSLERVLPGLVSVAYLTPYWLVARRLLPSRRQAGLATVLFAVTPDVLQWHLSAGGIVRAPAMFLTLSGIYAGVRLFESGERRWLVASTALFALVLLAHPVYAAFFGLSYLVLFAGLDRSAGGLLRGAAVAVGGLAATAPWWLSVISIHGADVFLGVNGTRTTVGGGLGRLGRQFGAPLVAMDSITPFYFAAFAGGVYAATRRRYLLPAWMVLSSYGLAEDRFTFVAGSMLAATLVVEVLLPAVQGWIPARRVPGGGRRDAVPGPSIDYRRAATFLTLGVVVVGAGAVGAAYAGSGLDTAWDHSTTMPQTVDDDDRAAMAWVEANTAPSAEFAVVGDAAEWFPHYADRTILVSPWGTEWTSPATFRLHLERYEQLSACDSAICLEWSLRGVPGDAEYVYVPTDEYTIRGQEHGPPDELVDSLERSPWFERRYENDGVVVFEAVRGE